MNYPARKRLFRITAIAGGILVAALVLEALLWMAPELFPSQVQQALQVGRVRTAVDSTIADDPELVVKMRPNIDLLIEHPERTWRMKTFLNYPEVGFRGNLTRLPVIGVAVGDSFTFGHSVNIEQTWTELLSGMLEKEIINLGVGGYAPPQYTRVLAGWGMPLNPKLVLYAIFQNDLDDSYCFTQSRDRDAYFACARQRRPPTAIERLFASHFSLYHVFVGMPFTHDRQERAGATGGKLSLPLRDALNWNDSERMLKGWQVAQEAILEAKRLTDQHHARLIILLIPSKTQTYWHLLEEQAPPGLERQLNSMNDLVKQLCAEHGIQYLDLTPLFRRQAQQAATGQLLYFRRDAHWNAEGHRLAAQTIYDYLVKNRLLDPVDGKPKEQR